MGRFNEVPRIDFDTEDAINIPVYDPSKTTSQPRVNVNTSYNPFKAPSGNNNYKRPELNWESLYEGFNNEKEIVTDNRTLASTSFFEEEDNQHLLKDLVSAHYQYKNKYILTSAKSGLMIIDQRRAHVSILFERFLNNIRSKKGVAQMVLFPEIIELSSSEASMIPYLLDDFEAVGFELSNLGNNSYAINAVPSELDTKNPVELVHNMITKSIDTASDVKEEIQEALALSMAYAAAIPYGHSLSLHEMEEIVNGLFVSNNHNFTPDGKTIINILTDEDIDKMFK